MSSAICFNLDQSKILSSCNGLKCESQKGRINRNVNVIDFDETNGTYKPKISLKIVQAQTVILVAWLSMLWTINVLVSPQPKQSSL